MIVTTHRTKPGISLPGFGVLVAGFVLFKALAMVWLGQKPYHDALAMLQDGTLFDRIAAFIMSDDVFSVYLANQILSVFS